jgi:hypothetical protein
LGIGTSSPSSKLEVVGIGRFNGLSVDGTSTYNGQITLGSSASAQGIIHYDGNISSAPLYIDNTYDDNRALMKFRMRTAGTPVTALTIDASGNLGLGVTPSAWGSPFLGAFEGKAGTALVGRSDAAQTFLFNNLYFNGSNYIRTATGYGNFILLDGYSGGIGFNIAGTGSGGSTASPTQAMTLGSDGNLLVGKTAVDLTVAGTQIESAGTVAITRDSAVTLVCNRKTNDGTIVSIRRDNTEVGSISATTSATAYNTSSDYRLKNSIAPMTGALAKVALLKPCTYKWNVNGSDGQGFIAHELAEVVPECVTGEKDAVDADGNPQYQGIDTSFLVATLTAAIQELKAEFDAYKASHP